MPWLPDCQLMRYEIHIWMFIPLDIREALQGSADFSGLQSDIVIRNERRKKIELHLGSALNVAAPLG